MFLQDCLSTINSQVQSLGLATIALTAIGAASVADAQTTAPARYLNWAGRGDVAMNDGHRRVRARRFVAGVGQAVDEPLAEETPLDAVRIAVQLVGTPTGCPLTVALQDPLEPQAQPGHKEFLVSESPTLPIMAMEH